MPTTKGGTAKAKPGVKRPRPLASTAAPLRPNQKSLHTHLTPQLQKPFIYRKIPQLHASPPLTRSAPAQTLGTSSQPGQESCAHAQARFSHPQKQPSILPAPPLHLAMPECAMHPASTCESAGPCDKGPRTRKRTLPAHPLNGSKCADPGADLRETLPLASSFRRRPKPSTPCDRRLPLSLRAASMLATMPGPYGRSRSCGTPRQMSPLSGLQRGLALGEFGPTAAPAWTLARNDGTRAFFRRPSGFAARSKKAGRLCHPPLALRARLLSGRAAGSSSRP
jgi:hypothetical protein